jgi:orotidine-5'-phosphate decarboxylase
LLAGLDQKGQGLVINASRSVLYAGPDEQFAAAAETAARDARNAIRDSR